MIIIRIKIYMSKKALIAMSGGVDSSVAAFIMKNSGYTCIGATMKLLSEESDVDVSADHSCCTTDDIEDARRVSESLGMKHYVFNFSDKFRKVVMDGFVNAYENGMTPNPCVECNRHLKFKTLFDEAKKLGCDLVVTGHYVRSGYDEDTGRHLLLRALDETKDQSYVLYSLNQEQLAHAYFPLGEYTKTQIRSIAQQEGFINADKPDSQDICFVPDGKYVDFIKRYTGKEYPEGDFVTRDGKVLGKHKGIIRYTVGQKKGLGLVLDPPLFVCDIDPKKNTVTLCESEELFSDTLIADDVNLISVESIEAPMKVFAKIRYRHKEQPAIVYPLTGGRIKVVFKEPQRAITRGQAVVLYDRENPEIVVGGGRIIGK